MRIDHCELRIANWAFRRKLAALAGRAAAGAAEAAGATGWAGRAGAGAAGVKLGEPDPTVGCGVRGVSAAGTPAESNPPFIVDSWTVENGPGKSPPDNEIISIVQTHDGYLWLGTLHGLVRFDGTKFTVFNVNNTPGLSSDRIVLIHDSSVIPAAF